MMVRIMRARPPRSAIAIGPPAPAAIQGSHPWRGHCTDDTPRRRPAPGMVLLVATLLVLAPSSSATSQQFHQTAGGFPGSTTTRAVVVPSTSLDTLPVVYMGGNSAPRPAENVEMLAKMRYVVIEKWEGPCWNECLANITKKTPCEPSCDEEAVQLATLAAVKKLNPKVAGIMYLNTILDFHFLRLHQTLVEADALVRNVDGSVCQLINDNGMTNITVYDYSKPIGQKIWLDEVQRLVETGTVDGFYGDTMQVYATENNRTGLWELCKKSHHTCCEMNESTAQLYNAGKNKTMEAAYEFLGPKAVFFKISNVMTHGGNTPEQMNATIAGRATAGLDHRGPYVHISRGDQRTSHDPHDVASACSGDDIALFMLAVQPGAFLGCDGWDPAFGKPLGTPTGPMARNSTDGTYSRSFASGTTVSWDPRLEGPKGRIHWAGDPPGPSPPPPPPLPPPPPPPPPPLPPTKTCPHPASDCSWPHANVGSKRVDSWSECCDVCSSRSACAKWVFHSGEASAAEPSGLCALHGSSAIGPHRLGPGSGKVCGTSNSSAY
jgi:hypothetical protein